MADEARIVTPVEFFGPSKKVVSHAFSDVRHPSQPKDPEPEEEQAENEAQQAVLETNLKAPKGAPAPD